VSSLRSNSLIIIIFYMRTTEVLATVAIAGAVATFAVLNLNTVQSG